MYLMFGHCSILILLTSMILCFCCANEGNKYVECVGWYIQSIDWTSEMQRLIYNFVFCITNKSDLLQVVTYVGRLKYCMYIIIIYGNYVHM